MKRTAIITGAGKGIGRAIGTRLAADGISVALWDRNSDNVRAVASEIRSSGGNALACVGDCSEPEFLADSLGETREAFGPITILINNAGHDRQKEFLNLRGDDVEEMLLHNFKAPLLCTQQVMPDMLASNWGRVINISSISTQNGAPWMVHYAAAKSALVGFTRALAMEFARAGVTANCVSPGMIDTPMLRRVPYDLDVAAERLPINRLGRPDEVAEACAYLASERSGYVTGQTINVNGGQYLG